MYAFTELHHYSYPAFVNVTEQQNGGLKLTVRSRGNNGNDIGIIELTNSQAKELGEAILQHVRVEDTTSEESGKS